MKLFSKIALATATVSIASVASAASISGSTDFRVTLPEILVLYHWDDAHLLLTSDQNYVVNDTATHEGEGDIKTSSHEITQNSVNTESDNTERTTNNRIAVTLKDSWAVRSLSNAPVTLTLDNTNNTLKSVVAKDVSSIKTEGAVLASGSNTGTSISIPSGWTAVKGDIKFDLNLENANHSGEYNTRGTAGPATVQQNDTDTFLLTLTGNAAVQP